MLEKAASMQLQAELIYSKSVKSCSQQPSGLSCSEWDTNKTYASAAGSRVHVNAMR